MENAPEIFDKLPEFSRIGSFSFIFWAILIGVFLSVVINMGPAFITLLQTSLHRGFRAAGWFATGVILNDAVVISLCILSSVQVVAHNGLEAALASIGTGVILTLFGIFTYRKKVRGREEETETCTAMMTRKIGVDDKPSWYVLLGKGFVLNILNPFVWLLWFSSVAVVAGKMGGNKISITVFFGIILGTTYTLELLKAWGAAKLKVFLTPKRTTMINRIAGVMLMLCGGYFIVFWGIMHLV